MAEHPALNAYVIVAVPGLTPVTTPVELPTVAVPVAPLVQLPPAATDVRGIVEPTQTDVGPEILVPATTVITIVTAQPATR